MNNLRALQERFLSYVLHEDSAIARDVFGTSDEESARRLSIYFNAYRARLRGSLDTDHAVLGRYLGDQLFDEMVRAYVDANPSAQTSLRHYCDSLPQFLQDHEPFSNWPVVAELAYFERLLMDVYDDADAERLTTDFLKTLAPEQWPGLTLTFHPSVRVFASQWNTVEIWRSMKAERDPPDTNQQVDSMWLVWRNVEQVTQFRSLRHDEHAVLSRARDGATFAQTCEILLNEHDEAAVKKRALDILSTWFNDGLIVRPSGPA